MAELAVVDTYIPAMGKGAVHRVYELEAIVAERPQTALPTKHILHAGLYARTLRLPKSHVMTGALIKIPTMIIMSGDASVFIGDKAIRLCGYNVVPASAQRKQVFYAHEDTDITMIFPTTSDSVVDAENEFTDEADLLMSRKEDAQNTLTITGD